VKPRDVFDLVLLGAIWGGAFPLLRVATPAFGPVPLVLVRCGFAAIVLLAMSGGLSRARGRRLPLFLLGILNTAVPFALFSYATLSITAGLASLLNATTPMFGALIAFLWLGERLAWLRALGILVGFVGVGTIVWSSISSSGEGAALGIAAGLSGAALYGVAASFAKRRLEDTDAVTVAAGSVCGAFIALAPLAVWQWPKVMPGAGEWVAAAALGLLCTALAYLIYFRLVRNVGPSRATTVTFLIPVFGILWGAIFLDEPITLALAGSCALVLFGTALATGFVRLPAR
jgi:drug/metabolite transporter (DMT)-like permease